MKKKLFSSLLILLLSIFSFTACLDDEEDYDYEDDTTAKTTASVQNQTTAGNQHDTSDAESFTLMIFMCGSDLESDYGCATTDLNEMLYGELSDSLNIIVETGGASEWQNSVISSDSVQRYQVSANGLDLLEDLGNIPFTNTDTLSDFISYCQTNFPADRYGFIFWDHGGGTIGGYGSDQNNGDYSMTLSEIQRAFAANSVHFDFIGYDCCLMGTVENAYALKNYADYLLASEETEPGTGWYYTNFVTQLSNDPGTPVTEFADLIISDFLSDEYSEGIESGVTLSLIDLSKIDAVVSALNSYMANSDEELRNYGYSSLSSARYNARSYGEDEFEQIDIIDYLEKAGLESSALKSAIQSAVVLNGTNMSGSNGLAMYYPYYYKEYYSEYRDLITSLGLSGVTYETYFGDFITVAAGGQVSTSSNPFGGTSESTNYEDSDWYDSDLATSYDGQYSTLDTDALYIEEKDDHFALSLSDEDWELITKLELQAYLDLGDGYLELGSDDWYEFDEDGDLIVAFDYTWVALNGVVVPYYVQESGEYSDGSYYSIGYIPALLNEDEEIRIYLIWYGDADPEVLGYTVSYNSSVSSKGYYAFNEGDTVDFIFNFYNNEGNCERTLMEDASTTYEGKAGFTISYESVGDNDALIYYYLQDIYMNEYYTESVEYTD